MLNDAVKTVNPNTNLKKPPASPRLSLLLQPPVDQLPVRRIAVGFFGGFLPLESPGYVQELPRTGGVLHRTLRHRPSAAGTQVTDRKSYRLFLDEPSVWVTGEVQDRRSSPRISGDELRNSRDGGVVMPSGGLFPLRALREP